MSTDWHPDSLEEWAFEFGLCANKPHQLVAYAKAEELMNLIVRWAEDNDLGIGGGFRRYDPDELSPFPLRPPDE
jgi:hypothetical protein